MIIRNILRLGVYEMCFGPEISHRIVINESVELCKDFVDDDSHGLVNRVLQKIWDQHQEYIAEKTSGEKSTSAESTESEPELPSEQAPSTPAQDKDSESSAL